MRKKLLGNLSRREYFWPPHWAKSRIDRLIQLGGRSLTKASSVALGSDITVQVGNGDDSVPVGNTPMEFIDGFQYAVELMHELRFSSDEIASRQKWMKWMFWESRLNDNAKMHCAELFLLKYHRHLDWAGAIGQESMIWMEGVGMTKNDSILRKLSTQKSTASPPRKRKKGVKSSRSHADRRDAPSSDGRSVSRQPLKERILGVCDSRVLKHITCRHERDGGDGKKCKFSHTCPRCPGEDHAASACGKL